MDRAFDEAIMGAALSLAARGLGRTRPNPSVGCILTHGKRIIARARTSDAGRPHAERRALEIAGPNAKGATAYVTLEPCSHHGATPPCAEVLINAGIARCVIALEDPDPRVSGRGTQMLRDAGIDVATGICEADARQLLSGYLTRQRLGRPEIALKLATTLDGRIATASGESRWITGPSARRLVHQMRGAADAVMIGSGTALADDPMLDVRDMGPVPQPIRVVVDTQLRIPATSRLALSADRQPVWVLHGSDADGAILEHSAVTCISVPTGPNGSVSLAEAMQELGKRGISSVLCEGGAGLGAGLLREGLVDRIALFTAGKAIGGEGIPALGELGLRSLSDAPSFTLEGVRPVGEDTLSLWQRRRP